MKARRELGRIFEASKEKPYQSRTFYPHDTFITNKKRSETVLHQNKMEEICCQYKCQAITIFQGKEKLYKPVTLSVSCV